MLTNATHKGLLKLYNTFAWRIFMEHIECLTIGNIS